MFDTLGGLPAHPLFVHLPVALVPLAAIGAVCMAVRPQWRQRFGVPVAIIAGVGFIGTLLAASTGRLTNHPLYAELAGELKLPLHEGGWAEVLGNARLRSDQIHANAAGYRHFAERLAGFLREQGFR